MPKYIVTKTVTYAVQADTEDEAVSLVADSEEGYEWAVDWDAELVN